MVTTIQGTELFRPRTSGISSCAARSSMRRESVGTTAVPGVVRAAAAMVAAIAPLRWDGRVRRCVLVPAAGFPPAAILTVPNV
jgi:hypothetical protein